MANPPSTLTARIRLGLWALPLAGLCFLIGLLLRGSPANDPTLDPAQFAQNAMAMRTALAWAILIVGMAISIFGWIALYAVLARAGASSERWAFFAMLLSVSGAALSIAFFAVISSVSAAIGRNYFAGQTDITAAMQGLFTGPLIFYLAVGALGSLSGTILFAWAIGSSQRLPRWAGGLLVIYYLLFNAPTFGFTGNTSLALESLGALVLIAAGVVLARTLSAERQPF